MKGTDKPRVSEGAGDAGPSAHFLARTGAAGGRKIPATKNLGAPISPAGDAR